MVHLGVSRQQVALRRDQHLRQSTSQGLGTHRGDSVGPFISRSWGFHGGTSKHHPSTNQWLGSGNDNLKNTIDLNRDLSSKPCLGTRGYPYWWHGGDQSNKLDVTGADLKLSSLWWQQYIWSSLHYCTYCDLRWSNQKHPETTYRYVHLCIGVIESTNPYPLLWLVVWVAGESR